MVNQILAQQFEVQYRDITKNIKNLASCFIIAYDEGSESSKILVNKYFISELRYYLRKTEISTLYEEKISGILSLIGMSLIHLIMNEYYQEISKKDSKNDYF